MKIVMTDNYDRDYVDDILICEILIVFMEQSWLIAWITILLVLMISTLYWLMMIINL